MTGHTGHLLPGARVNHLLAHRMTELALGQMATCAHLVAIIPKHRQPVGAMHLMTVTARLDAGVAILALCITGKSVFMALLTHLVARVSQHVFIIRGMGAVTEDATVFRPGQHMIMRGHHAGFHAGMTPQADFASGTLLMPVTRVAFFFGKGRMLILADKTLA